MVQHHFFCSSNHLLKLKRCIYCFLPPAAGVAGFAGVDFADPAGFPSFPRLGAAGVVGPVGVEGRVGICIVGPGVAPP
ncbi:hypothetical protein ACFX11_041476 [Malus domestica]